MKYVKVLIPILIITLVFSGCNFKLASSIDNLISPISPFGDNADIQSAMDSYVKNGYSLKTPSGGKHIASYSFVDINNDSVDEAISFYEPSDDLGTIDMAILMKVNNQWTVVENIKGDGKDIYSLDFCDLNGDGDKEILVCWDVISNSTNHNLSIYKYNFNKKNSKFSLKQIAQPLNINNYVCADVNGDNIDEICVFKINTGASTLADAQLYYLDNETVRLLGETKLDSTVANYTKIQTEKTDDGIKIYADAIKSDGSSMLTELIYWSDYYNSIISPFYSYSTGLTQDTTRSAMINCMDVNDDGIIEIPTDKSIKKLPKEICAVDWSIYKNTVLLHSNYSLVNKQDKYIVVIDDKYINNILVQYNTKNRLMTVKSKSKGKEIFEVMPVLKSLYSADKYKGYTKIMDNSGYTYLAKINSDSDINITIDQLKDLIKSY